MAQKTADALKTVLSTLKGQQRAYDIMVQVWIAAVRIAKQEPTPFERHVSKLTIRNPENHVILITLLHTVCQQMLRDEEANTFCLRGATGSIICRHTVDQARNAEVFEFTIIRANQTTAATPTTDVSC